MRNDPILFVGNWSETWSQAIQQLRDEGFPIVGWVSTSREALQRLPSAPAIIVTDVELTDMSGIDFCRLLTSRDDGTRVIFFTDCSKGETILEAVLAGCSGYCLQGLASSSLSVELRKIMSGQSSIVPEAKSIAVMFLKHSLDKASLIANKLTGREQEIAYLLFRSWTYREIGNSLGISAHTVRNHTSHILRKLNLRSRTSIRIMVTRALGQNS